MAADRPASESTNPKLGRSLKNFVRDGLRELWVSPPGNLPALDGARAIAVLLVICGHYAYEWKELGQPHLSLTSLPIFTWGWTGVDLFFILSGLLIGQQLWKEYQSTSSVDLFQFVMKRGFRIWPLYFATLLALTMLPLVFRPIWTDFVFVSNYVHAGSGYVRGWSLSAEEQFYLLTPFLFFVLRRRGPRWIFGALCSILVCVLLSRWGTSQALLAQGLDAATIKDKMYYPFHLHSDALFAGLMLAYLNVHFKGALNTTDSHGFARRIAAVGIVLAMLGLVLRHLDGFVFGFFALALIYVSLVAWLLVDRSVVSAPFRWRIFYPLSRLSFGMYLNHFVVPGTAAFFIASARQVTSSESLVFLFGLLGSIMQSVFIAAVTFVLIERPGLLARARFLAWYKNRANPKGVAQPSS